MDNFHNNEENLNKESQLIRIVIFRKLTIFFIVHGCSNEMIVNIFTFSINNEISLLHEFNQWNCISFLSLKYFNINHHCWRDMNNDQIVSDLISLIQSSTQSNYVLCSQISSKIFSYFSRISFVPNSWDELNQAIEVMKFFGKRRRFLVDFLLEIRSKFWSSRSSILSTIGSNKQHLFECLWRTKLHTWTRWNDSQRFN